MSDAVSWLLVGMALGILVDGLIFDWPFRRK